MSETPIGGSYSPTRRSFLSKAVQVAPAMAIASAGLSETATADASLKVRPELIAAADTLETAHANREAWIKRSDAASATYQEWLAANPMPRKKKDRVKWDKEFYAMESATFTVEHSTQNRLTHQALQGAQVAMALIPATSMIDMKYKAAMSALYEHRNHPCIIGYAVAHDLLML